METTAKLVYKTTTQRFYELSEPIVKGIVFKQEFDIVQEMNDMLNRLKPQYHKDVPKDGCHIICISDATTHTERLVFAAINFSLSNKYSRTDIQIDGKHTFMIHGGNQKDVHKDEIYIRHLGMLNGVRIKII